MPVPPRRPRRQRPISTYSLSIEAIAALASLADYEGISRSAVVERLIRREARLIGLDVEALGKVERKRRRLPAGRSKSS